MMGAALHHISKRRRIHKKKEQFPNPNQWIRFLDKFLLILAIVGPFMSLPQILKIWIYQNAQGVSIISFSLLTINTIPWTIYGFVHKEKPIIISYLLWFLSNLLIVVGAVIYQ